MDRVRLEDSKRMLPNATAKLDEAKGDYRMSSDDRGAAGGAPRYAAGDGSFGSGRQGGGSNGGGGGQGRNNNKKRRRQRAQRGKRPRGGGGGGGGGGHSSSPHGEMANKERIFQDIEGLLRQIREAADEENAFSEAQVGDYVQAVTGLQKAFESEATMVSDRAFSEYQRVRDKLQNALRNHNPNF